MANEAFSPAKFGRCITISGTTTSASATLNTDVATSETAYIYNSGPDMAFMRWGNGTQTAVTTDLPIPPGSLQTLYTGGAPTFAAITSSGTAAIYIYPGKGM